MNDFTSFEKTIVRELSCRLCLCNDVTKLKPLSSELKRKLKRLFDVNIRADDTLPKAICHDCFQQVSNMHLYTVKVEKTQKFLDFHKQKTQDEKRDIQNNDMKLHPLITTPENPAENVEKGITKPKTPPLEHQQGDTKLKLKHSKKKNTLEMKYLEAMTLDEFAKTEKVDKNLLNTSEKLHLYNQTVDKRKAIAYDNDLTTDTLDTIVLTDGRPTKTGAALDRQITLFYKMECCICHENGFHYRSLMKHYKDRHGVPGYVTCCNKKFHYFYPKKIIEHMAYHLQPNIFMCSSCHQNFPTSQELLEHQVNGGRSEGKVLCPRCSERFPTYHELGWHLQKHRTDRIQCDYCGKILKHHHRKKTVNRMEDVILCSQCLRSMKNIEKQEKEQKERMKQKDHDVLQKHQKFTDAMGLYCDDEASTD